MDSTALGFTPEQAMRAAAWAYGLSVVFHCFGVFGSQRILERLGRGMLVIGFFILTVALALRWKTAGLAHPPLLQAFERFLFLSWAVAVTQVVANVKGRAWWSGIFASALALAGTSMAYIHPERGIVSVDPNLVSPWFAGFELFTLVGYAALMLSFATSVFFLVKAPVGTDSVVAMFSALMTAGGVLVARTEPMTPLLKRVLLGGAGWFGFHLVLVGAAALVRRWRRVSDEPMKEGASPFALVLRGEFAVGVAGLVAWVGYLVYANAKIPGFLIQDAPVRFAAAILALVLGAVFAAFQWIRPGLERRLPAASELDRWSYQFASAGWVALTVALVLGAVWSRRSLGGYLSWSPRENWMLIVWLFFAIWIQGRAMEGGERRKMAAVLNFVGFVLVGMGLWQASFS